MATHGSRAGTGATPTQRRLGVLNLHGGAHSQRPQRARRRDQVLAQGLLAETAALKRPFGVRKPKDYQAYRATSFRSTQPASACSVSPSSTSQPATWSAVGTFSKPMTERPPLQLPAFSGPSSRGCRSLSAPSRSTEVRVHGPIRDRLPGVRRPSLPSATALPKAQWSRPKSTAHPPRGVLRSRRPPRPLHDINTMLAAWEQTLNRYRPHQCPRLPHTGRLARSIRSGSGVVSLMYRTSTHHVMPHKKVLPKLK